MARGNDGHWKVLFFFSVGVIQGCPLAGFCFTISMDPLLRYFNMHIYNKGRGLVRACADDVGMALESVLFLKPVLGCYDIIALISGLKLKLSKTWIVPLFCNFSPETQDLLQTIFFQMLPDCVGVHFAGAARYLGAFLGPDSGTASWESPLSKFTNRSHGLAKSQASGATAEYIYIYLQCQCC